MIVTRTSESSPVFKYNDNNKKEGTAGAIPTAGAELAGSAARKPDDFRFSDWVNERYINADYIVPGNRE